MSTSLSGTPEGVLNDCVSAKDLEILHNQVR